MEAATSAAASIILLVAVAPALAYLASVALREAGGVEGYAAPGNTGVLYLLRDGSGFRLYVYVEKPPRSLMLHDSSGLAINLLEYCGSAWFKTCVATVNASLKPPVVMYVDGVAVEGRVVTR
ncbi:hypothetical protein Desmu_0481 [Desulfurococcus mucosus DSM 2162]|uniref:Uncharacterized protein n=1 Tax=Desulfurococcus mucosus (strain ATCC 35584 / DSM 2162 / JCM 9187 / O7/1) TaxID=765177 RepID=E8R8G8_DESM0|nr:hypothetical protein Desmu_0481 [Desulfurococcus mucosus DSM 2162]